MEHSQFQQQDFLANNFSNPNYIVIPIELWYNKGLGLSWQERVLLAEIDTYTRSGKECFMSNKYIAEFLEINETNASRVLSSLIEKGFVEKTRFDGRRRFITSTLKTCFSEQTSLAEKSKADLPNSATYYNKNTNTSLLINKEKKIARAREEIIADIIENNTAWVENQIKSGIEPDDIPALLDFAYDYHINTKGEEPARQQLMSDAFYQLRNFKEHKRREAIGAKDIEERKRDLWKKLLPFIGKEFPRPMVVEFYKFCINLNDGIMYFEQWPEYDIEASLRQHKVKYEQRNKHTTL